SAAGAINGWQRSGAGRRGSEAVQLQPKFSGEILRLGLSWSPSSGFGNVAHQAHRVSLSVGHRGNPDLSAIHPRDDVWLLETRRPGRFDRLMCFFDVAHVVEEHRVLLVSVLTLGCRSGEHQTHTTAI